MTGKVPQRAGNTNPIAAPSEVFRCVDGFAIVAAGNNSQFAGLCKVVGRSELAADERFASNARRVTNRTALVAILAPIVETYPRDELLARLLECGVPCGPINDMEQVFDDQQTRHRALAVPMRHASGVDITLVRSPLRFSASPVEHRAPPLLGEHSEQVLAEELGLTGAQIRGLRERGIL
jgi:crotonobetainyl-CoA:carnitine CoA-transferase CaiB-like acyl-CoA transferase